MARSLPLTRHPALLLPLVLGTLGLLAYVAWTAGLGRGDLDRLVNDGVYNGVQVLAVVACVARAVISPGERSIWLWLGAGLGCWAAGDLYWTLELSTLDSVPYPSLADPLYLAGYVALYVAVALLIRKGVRLETGTWLDGMIGGLAAAALGAALLAPALIGVTAGSAAEVATNLAYPLGDVLLLAFMVAGATFTRGRAGAAWWLIGAGLVVSAVADGLYLYQEAAGTYTPGLTDSLWLIGSLVVAAAALFPLHGRLSQAHGGSILLPTAFALLTVGILTADLAVGIGVLARALAVATVAVVVLRLVLTFRENATLLRAVHEEAVTDPLTDLGNRRAMMRDLDRALDRNGPQLVFAIFDLDGFKSYNDTFGHPAGDLLLRRMGAALATAAAPHGAAYRLGGDEFCVLIRAGVEEAAAVIDRAHAALSEDGEGFRIRASGGVAFLPQEAADASGALGLADARMYAEKGQRPSSALAQTHNLMVRVQREREPELSEHVSEVARMVAAMARGLDLSPEELDDVVRAAELHDIGKVGIPDRILLKPAGLDPDERELMRSHTVIGERILQAAPSMARVARLVRSSHEYWDGSGYPDGLAGDAIPLGARVISICDAFEAMTSDRPYRDATTPDAALAELRRCAGTQFDPVLVELFARTAYRDLDGHAYGPAGYAPIPAGEPAGVSG